MLKANLLWGLKEQCAIHEKLREEAKFGWLAIFSLGKLFPPMYAVYIRQMVRALQELLGRNTLLAVLCMFRTVKILALLKK